MEPGTEKIVRDLEAVLEEAKTNAFHDFRSPHPTPKIELVKRLKALIDKVTGGEYDD